MGYTFEEVRAKDLRVDPRVQRDREEAHVNKLVKSWRPDFIGCLIGSRRKDGHIYLTDGQQRRWAQLEIDPEGTLPVMVHDDWTVATEGGHFLATNKDNKAVHPVDKYKVAVNVGNSPEAEVNELLTSMGLRVERNASENTLACPSALVRIAKMRNPVDGEDWREIMRDTLDLNRYAGFHRRERQQWDAVWLEGLGIFISRWKNDPNYDYDRLKVLVESEIAAPHTIVQEARNYSAYSANNRAVGALATILQTKYDQGRRVNKLGKNKQNLKVA